MNKTPLRVAALAGLMSLATGSALGQDAEYRRDCTADYSRLCSAYAPGSAEVGQCFQQRFRELSPRCQATIRKYNPPANQRSR